MLCEYVEHFIHCWGETQWTYNNILDPLQSEKVIKITFGRECNTLKKKKKHNFSDILRYQIAKKCNIL